jgi:putative membrane-bound dehydrogenase-like protein
MAMRSGPLKNRIGVWRALLLLAAASIGGAVAQADDAPEPLSPQETISHMKLPDGFHATVFAAEPDVVQPIAMAFDDRGRLWVVECLSYPGWEGKQDRVVILEDRDGDGRFDERKVFWDKGENLSGINVGFGGVWLCSTPNLIFLPDADGNDQPDGPPQVMVDGFSIHASHNVFNSLNWGPDGWLYGLNGILSNSEIGRPGTPTDQRVKINCGVWRYHPTSKIVEAVAHGTTNPWGLDFDDYGQMFITNCVIAHLWHVIPGGHYERMFGQDYDPHTYDLIDTCADHLHWAGGHWTEARGGAKHDDAGGGHAHVGAMVYLGDNWPDSYRNHIFTCNIHGHRLNQDVLERRGSGYVAHHGKDLMQVDDTWFRGLVVTYGPDGGVYVSDWTDTGECHNYKVADKTNGRIYKLTSGDVHPWHDDLAKKSDRELVDLQLHKNDWLVRQARRLLQERHAAGKLEGTTREQLLKIITTNPDATRKLRALWALHATGGVGQPQLEKLLADPSEYLRGWAIQLELEDRSASPDMLRRLAALAQSDPSPWVRLALAAGLQRLPVDQRWTIATALAQHGEDAGDANLPLMLWYGVEPLVAADAKRGLDLALDSRIPIVSTFIARRAGEDSAGLALVVAALGKTEDPGMQARLLEGALTALHGHRRVDMPEGWDKVYAKLSLSTDGTVHQGAMALAVIFNDANAIATLHKLIADQSASTADRTWAIERLLEARDSQLVELLQPLVGAGSLSGLAVRGLAVFDSPKTPGLLLSTYDRLSEADRRDAINTLCARPAWASILLQAIDHGELPRTVLSVEQVRQIAGFGNADVSAELDRVWGIVRETTADKQALLQNYRSRLPSDRLKSADLSQGRAIFARVCSNCHTLFDAGGNVGPNLTGSQRANTDYVLTNVLDPNAVVAKEYRMVVIQTTDGRVLNGIVRQEDDLTLGLQTTNELVTLAKDEIEVRNPTALSMMPEGMLIPLGDDELRDLIAYLASPQQVPLPEGGAKAK